MGNRSSIKDSAKMEVAFPPQALSSTTDITGEVIDTQGFEEVVFVLQTDAIAASSLDAQLLISEDDDSGFGTSSAVDDADLVGTEAATAIDEDDDKVTKKIAYVGSKRYVRCDLTVTTNNGTDVVACMAILGRPNVAPQA